MSLVAALHGRCNSCGEGIEPGHEIERDQDGEWSHEECIAMGGPMPTWPVEVCTECFIIKPCECDS